MLLFFSSSNFFLQWERDYLRCFRFAQVEPFGSHPFSSTSLRWERDYLRCFRFAQVEPFGSHPFSSTSLRWERDSNPRYSYPYDSLANCWFQPLTHPTLCSMNGWQKYKNIPFLKAFFVFFLSLVSKFSVLAGNGYFFVR